MAWIGTLIGAVLSLPLGFLAARTIAPAPVVFAVRQFLNAVRALPEIILAIVLIMLAMWRKCIVRCVAIIRESTKVFKTVPGLIIWPLLTIAGLTLVMVFGLVLYAVGALTQAIADGLARSRS